MWCGAVARRGRRALQGAADDAATGRPGVVQTSFSCSFGAIHLLAPYKAQRIKAPYFFTIHYKHNQPTQNGEYYAKQILDK
jgi:hypothetical protein